ncbi:cytochrome c biogenesis CcdA family protein [Mycobacteroides abscessus]|uniref:cytochrome c biogenesis CcdA family protein n=1 Tax=Mycobacteroides abscessus TaxID=36809 RepID=UPI0009A5D6F9|nr:cytochrome c biogenesis CcdA family protein [Mycobacteroides abscessus]
MIDTAALSFALGAGLVAGLNPCGFAFLPGYLGLVIAGTDRTASQLVALCRAAVATIAMAAGFVTVFGIFGMVISPVVASAGRYMPFATVVIGVALIGLAIWLLSGRELNSVVLPRLSGTVPTSSLLSMYGYGLTYAIASLSCTVGPFLAVISTTFKQGSIIVGILSFTAYGAGMAITVGVAALAVALVGSSAGMWLRRALPYVNRIAGAVVLLTGLYVTYYGFYEIRLYFGDGTAVDPIINVAIAIQGWLAGMVDTVGVWPALVAISVLVSLAAGGSVALRRRGSGSRKEPPHRC